MGVALLCSLGFDSHAYKYGNCPTLIFFTTLCIGTVQGKPKKMKMKKTLLSVLALLALAGNGTAQTLPSYVPANGLVGWWPFNGNANDESGNNNNGTVNGATLTSDRFGNVGKAYSFDGIDDFIEIIHHPSLNLPNGTINLWFKTSSNNRMCLFNKANFNDASNENYNATLNYFSPGVSGIGYFSKYNSNCLPGFGWVGAANSLNFSDGTYHMISCITSSTSIQIFVDAILQSNIAAPNAQADTCSNSNLRIGQNWTNYLEPYIGGMDDIAIYNRALTQQEITSLYQGANTTANCPTFPASLAQGLVGYWPFCGNALDESGNNNHGTVNGATLTADRFGNTNSAYSFQNNHISLPTTIQQGFGSSSQTQFTFSCWFKNNDSLFNNPGSSFVGGRNQNGSAYTGLGSWPNTKAIRWYVNQQTTNLAESISFQDIQNWNHVVGTYQTNPSPRLRLYYNGVLVDTAIAAISTNPWTQTNQFNLGADMFYPRYFKGSLDDIAIWNRALTPQEITQLYNQGICQTSITVTDTLLIHTGITSYNPVAYGNTLKVWPNPGNTAITLDAGNLALMQGWKIRISNSLGQEVYPATLISQQQQVLSMSTWGGNGLYLLHLINPQGHITEVKKIVLAP